MMVDEGAEPARPAKAQANSRALASTGRVIGTERVRDVELAQDRHGVDASFWTRLGWQWQSSLRYLQFQNVLSEWPQNPDVGSP